MTALGPKAEAALREGPQFVDGALVALADGRTLRSRAPESLESFARRVAMIAVEEERERSIKQCDQSACAAEIADLKARLEQEHDIRIDREAVIDSVAESLKVEVEPHQSFFERLCDAAAIREGR